MELMKANIYHSVWNDHSISIGLDDFFYAIMTELINSCLYSL